IQEPDFRHYWEHIALMDPALFLSLLQEVGEHSAEETLKDVRTPTLVIAGERDTFTPPELMVQMATMIPGAEYLALPGASHAAPVEQPARIQQAMHEFLERIQWQ